MRSAPSSASRRAMDLNPATGPSPGHDQRKAAKVHKRNRTARSVWNARSLLPLSNDPCLMTAQQAGRTPNTSHGSSSHKHPRGLRTISTMATEADSQNTSVPASWGHCVEPQFGLRTADFLSRSEEQRLNSSHLVISYAVFCLT